LFGLSEPAAGGPEAIPSVVLVPLLAFDSKGNRLGYGAGYYDAALRDLRQRGPVIAIGLGFDEQQFPAIPQEPQDEPLDMILTPSRIIACGE
jgi:5-formyltetrahydrofolate cyclo-ligase